MDGWKVFEEELRWQLLGERLEKPRHVVVDRRIAHGAALGLEPRALEYHECARYAAEARKLLMRAGYYPALRWIWQSPDPHAARVVAYAMESWHEGVPAREIDSAVVQRFNLVLMVANQRLLAVAHRTAEKLRWKYAMRGIQLVCNPPSSEAAIHADDEWSAA